MRSILLKLLSMILLAFVFSSYNFKSYNHNSKRSIYLLLNLAQELLVDKQQLKETFKYIVNDMSPGDSIAIRTPYKAFFLNLAKESEKAYIQKRDFKHKFITFINKFKPTKELPMLLSFAQAKAFLDKKIAPFKSIIYYNMINSLVLKNENLKGYTVSVLNFKKKDISFSKIKNEIEIANGQFVLALDYNDINSALAYR